MREMDMAGQRERLQRFGPSELFDRQHTREKLHENRFSLPPVSTSVPARRWSVT